VGNLPGSASDGDLAVTLDTDTLYIYDGVAWNAIGAPSAPLTISDTNSIDLTITGNNLTADLNLSVAAADAGFINATASIEADGLQVQVELADTNTSGALSDTDWNTFNNKQPATVAATLLPVGATQTVDWTNGNVQVLDLSSASGDVTLTLSNPIAGNKYTMLVIQGATPRNLIWPAACLFPQAQDPILSTGNGDIDKIELIYIGASYYADWNVNYGT
jgi:hypothetical protein